MSNGIDKHFEINDTDKEETLNEEVQSTEYDSEEDVEIISITMKTDTRKKYAAAVIARSVEDYETYIEGHYFETLVHPVSKEEYQVKVTLLRPEINPMELMRPAYAYSTNH